jgi:hypothetical protein
MDEHLHIRVGGVSFAIAPDGVSISFDAPSLGEHGVEECVYCGAPSPNSSGHVFLNSGGADQAEQEILHANVKASEDHLIARWMGTTPVCRGCGTMGLFLDGEDGRTFRFRIHPDSMRQLIEAATDLLAYVPAPGQGCRQCRSQSDNSSGRPHSDGSRSEGHSV